MEGRFERFLNNMPLIGIFRGVTPGEAVSVVDAAVACGLHIVEVPLNSPDALISIGRLAKRYGPEVMVGAGTVTSIGEVAAVAEAGGELIVTPYARGAIVNQAKELGLTVIPGALSPTEVVEMIDCGADAVKLFPAEMCPPAVVKAFRAVLPDRYPLIPVGGIDVGNLAAYWHAGASGFGLGSALYRPGDDVAKVAQNAAALVGCMRELI
jgi:2-dehydro-3-deoxyphosphogalactonate aldolase